jgi:anti-sigma regulatory factor (Ser/Thr protein kinase)
MSEPGRSAESIAVFGNRIDEIGAAAQLAQDFGARHSLASGVIHDLCVAFDEALSNVVKYGYRDDARHEISVRLAIAGTHVVAEIEDDGVPFDPLSAPPPRLEGGIDERPIGGLGIYLLRQLMDEVRYVRRGNRNVLVMKKRISEDAAPESGERHGNDSRKAR